MRKAVITGGTRLIGQHLTRLLTEGGFEVHVTTTRDEAVLEGAVLHVADVRDLKKMSQLCAGAEYVFHLAAVGDQACIDDPVEAESINVGGTISALMAAKKAGAKKFIFASSAMVYGPQKTVPLREDMTAAPDEPYGLYKYFGEKLVRLWSKDVPGVSLRFFNAYGPGDQIGVDAYVVGRLLHKRLQKEPLTIDGDGTDTRDYVHAADIARACLAAAESSVEDGDVFNVGSGVETSLNELAACIGGEIVHIDSRAGARRGATRRVADISKAKKVLGWKPEVTLKEGIRSFKHKLGIE